MYPVASPTQLVGRVIKVGDELKFYAHNPAPAFSLAEFFSLWQGRDITITIEENNRTYTEA